MPFKFNVTFFNLRIFCFAFHHSVEYYWIYFLYAAGVILCPSSLLFQCYMTWINFILFFCFKVYQEFGRRSRRKWFKSAEPTELLRRFVRFKHCTNRLELMKQRKDGRLKRIKENWHEVVFKLIGLKIVTSPLLLAHQFVCSFIFSYLVSPDVPVYVPLHSAFSPSSSSSLMSVFFIFFLTLLIPVFFSTFFFS